jgi:hypothetical protein
MTLRFGTETDCFGEEFFLREEQAIERLYSS